MKLQLWSYNYDPEPCGIAPLSTVLAGSLRDRGHDVSVVAAHPHYPEPLWGRRIRPYRELRDGIPVLRLPLWIGRETSAERVRQEVSFVAAKMVSLPALERPDLVIAVSPSFPALSAAMVYSRARRVPWVMWLQDILPDGAATTGIMDDGRLLRASRKLEHAAYASASHIVVISDSFKDNLVAKGVPERKITRLYNPCTRDAERPVASGDIPEPRLLNLGNIGHSQGLVDIVRAFERSEELASQRARLAFAGTGVAAEEVERAVTTDRVDMRGVLFGDELEAEIQRATVGIVSQRADLAEFNVPSKLMNLFRYGVPVIASVRPGSEVDRLVRRSGGGWVTDAARPDEFARAAAEAIANPTDRRHRGAAGFAFAEANLTPATAAALFESVIGEIVERGAEPREAYPVAA
jgi:colanic acid biosynthesis glycosyl transferase WcaI